MSGGFIGVESGDRTGKAKLKKPVKRRQCNFHPMDSTHSIYDTPGSLMDYTDRRDEPWQAHDGMELGLVDKDGQGESASEKRGQATLKRGKPTTIGPKYFAMESSSIEGSFAHGSLQPQVYKLLLGLVLLSFVLTLVAVILASVALKSLTGSSAVSDGSLPASQTSFGTNSSTGMHWLCSLKVVLRVGMLSLEF